MPGAARVYRRPPSHAGTWLAFFGFLVVVAVGVAAIVYVKTRPTAEERRRSAYRSFCQDPKPRDDSPAYSADRPSQLVVWSGDGKLGTTSHRLDATSTRAAALTDAEPALIVCERVIRVEKNASPCMVVTLSGRFALYARHEETEIRLYEAHSGRELLSGLAQGLDTCPDDSNGPARRSSIVGTVDRAAWLGEHVVGGVR